MLHKQTTHGYTNLPVYMEYHIKKKKMKHNFYPQLIRHVLWKLQRSCIFLPVPMETNITQSWALSTDWFLVAV